MNCKDALKKMSAFIDNELKDNESAEMSGHIDGCTECRKQYEALYRAWKVLEAVKEIEATADFEQKFWQRARDQKWGNRFLQTLILKFSFGRAPMFAALAFFVFGIISGFMLSEKIIYFNQKSVKTTISKTDILHLSNLKNNSAGSLYKTYYSLFKNI